MALAGEPSLCWKGHSRDFQSVTHCLLSTQQGDNSHHLGPVPAEGVTCIPTPDPPALFCTLHPMAGAPQGETAGSRLLFTNAPGWGATATQRGHPLPRLWVFPELKARLPGGLGIAHTQGGRNPLPPGRPLNALPWEAHPLSSPHP